VKRLIGFGASTVVACLGFVGCGASDNVVGTIAGTYAGTDGPPDASGGQGGQGDTPSRGGSIGEAGDSSDGNNANGGTARASGGTKTAGSAGREQTPSRGGEAGFAPVAGGSGGHSSSGSGTGATSGRGGTSSSSGGVSAAGAGGNGGRAGNSGVAGNGEGANTDCVVRVSTSGNDSNRGSSWAFALASVQRGLGAASDLMSEGSCSTVELWVAAGTYRPTLAGDRTASFQLVAGVALYGGFAGNESVRPERDVSANETILSGDGGTPEDDSDDSYHVVRGANGATLDGFTVSGGLANGDSDLVGAGMYNVSASPIVANCTFTNNVASAGAGMYNDTSSPTVTNCAFTNNSAPMGDGGGMHNETSSPAVSNCAFTQNNARYSGGGMSNEYSSPTVVNSTFTNNTAQTGGGIGNASSRPTVTDCTFTENSAYEGGGMSNANQSAATVTNARFTGNSAYLGGGMANFGSSPTVTNSAFTSNVVEGTALFTGIAAAAGGGMDNESSSPVVTNCVFSNNSSAALGGGMSNLGSSPIVTNSTFTSNSSDSAGAGIYDDSVSLPTVTNSILWGDTAGGSPSELVDSDTTSSATVSHSLVQGGYDHGVDLITADPAFVAAAMGDLQLSSGSPAIDAGDGCATFVQLTDASGNPRWDIASVPNTVDGLDLGAFEYQGTAGTDTRIATFACP
jgi:hypothetical protein